MTGRDKWISWGIFILLSFIWGSSFKLIKIGIDTITPYQVASLRLLSAGLVLAPFAIRAFQLVPRNKIMLTLLSGLFGSFFPAFLFCIAETKVDSSLAGILNALTPISTLIIGFAFFQNKAGWKKVLGIFIGFVGSALCIYFKSKGHIKLDYISYAGLILIATIFYGLNVNMVGRHLKEVGSLRIAAVAFTLLIIPSLGILYTTGFFTLDFSQAPIQQAIGASVLLGVMGTAFASVIFYVMLKKAGVFFSSLVTYGIPVVAIIIGSLSGEFISAAIILSVCLILSGVYLANK
jgi:drug/metabolite transporter (DMT)-like permease